MEEQKKTEEMRKEYEAKIKDLQKQLYDKHEELSSIEMKLDDNDKSNSNNIIEELKVCQFSSRNLNKVKFNVLHDFFFSTLFLCFQKSNYICSEDDAKIKEEKLENEEQTNIPVNSNEQNNIHLTVSFLKI